MSLKNFQMYQLALKGVRLVRPLIAEIAKHDRDLATQLRKSVTSVPLNTSSRSISSTMSAEASSR